jgi:hypothetical protein
MLRVDPGNLLREPFQTPGIANISPVDLFQHPDHSQQDQIFFSEILWL